MLNNEQSERTKNQQKNMISCWSRSPVRRETKWLGTDENLDEVNTLFRIFVHRCVLFGPPFGPAAVIQEHGIQALVQHVHGKDVCTRRNARTTHEHHGFMVQEVGRLQVETGAGEDAGQFLRWQLDRMGSQKGRACGERSEIMCEVHLRFSSVPSHILFPDEGGERLQEDILLFVGVFSL